MAGESTLIVTTRSGVRPLGVRGEPLHNSAVQLARIVRRRLGDAAADLLAEPQLHADGKAIDWYANWAGEVRQVVDLDPKERGEILSHVDRGLIEIGRLGQTLSAADGGEDTGAIGRSLRLAARRPAESFVFLVGDRPVVVCWGYEKEAANGLLPPGLPRLPQRQSVLNPPAPLPLPAAAPVDATARTIPWFRTLLFALPLIALLLDAVWMLRDMLPVYPSLTVATREAPDGPAASPPIDRRPVLKASLAQEQARTKALQIEMADIESELKKRIAECRPPAPPKPPPKPPQSATVAPPPKAAPAPARPRAPSDNRLRLPSGPTRDYSFLKGCWRSDPFRHELTQIQPGVSSYCFDSSGYGELEWRKGRVACRTGAQAHFDGSTLRLRDSDTTCNDGSHWFADQLVCQRGADNVAQCSGYSRGAFGPTSWTVNLHKLD
jgi:hypothetical protein